ncbi:acetyl-coenzyme A transporter 1-like protein, partial [Leptotrombidium deliense]
MDEVELNRRASVASSIFPEKKLEEIQDEDRRGLKGDYLNLCILLLLYISQGIPIGLLATIPMIFSANKVPYNQQAIFSFAGYPYAIKLLWAPIVDSVYSERFGRRKT